MLACSAMSYAAAWGGAFPRQFVKSRAQLYKISLLGAVFCVTVALGNVSLRYIPVSFNQAIGATTPAFTALLTVLMAHKRETPVRWERGLLRAWVGPGGAGRGRRGGCKERIEIVRALPAVADSHSTLRAGAAWALSGP